MIMTLPRKHFNSTYDLVKKIDKAKIAKWLLEEGYYAEQYVLPPCFHVREYNLKTDPYYKVESSKRGWKSFKPDISEFITVSYPKSKLTDRIFGIIEPKIYHDIVWHIINEWDFVLTHLFCEDIEIFPYSFPIPLTTRSEGELGTIRAGRLIYEWVEMAEHDLIAEAHKYKYMLKSDIKNFYPSIYTHSLAWILHGKKEGRDDKSTFSLLGSKIDKLFQASNDGCTNGIPIGSALSDLVSEIMLAGIDRECSKLLKKMKMRFLAVRFKDDYRFLCNSQKDADCIFKILQHQMGLYNLSLSDEKSTVTELPEGLFRPSFSEYQKYSLRRKKRITYKTFETTLSIVRNIDQNCPNTGLIDKFLAELISKKDTLKLSLKRKEALKVFSLLLLLKKRRPKAFPQILAIIELIMEKFKTEKELINTIANSLQEFLDSILETIPDHQYDILWLLYFFKSNELLDMTLPEGVECPLLQSIESNKQEYFNSEPDIQLYEDIASVAKSRKLASYLAMFPLGEK